MDRKYFLATGLLGFRSSALRVRFVEFHNADNVSVMTADLLDAGTMLRLDPKQLMPISEGRI